MAVADKKSIGKNGRKSNIFRNLCPSGV